MVQPAQESGVEGSRHLLPEATHLNDERKVSTVVYLDLDCLRREKKYLSRYFHCDMTILGKKAGHHNISRRWSLFRFRPNQPET